MVAVPCRRVVLCCVKSFIVHRSAVGRCMCRWCHISPPRQPLIGTVTLLISRSSRNNLTVIFPSLSSWSLFGDRIPSLHTWFIIVSTDNRFLMFIMEQLIARRWTSYQDALTHRLAMRSPCSCLAFTVNPDIGAWWVSAAFRLLLPVGNSGAEQCRMPGSRQVLAVCRLG